MHPRIAEILDLTAESQAALADAVARVPADIREQRPAPDRWSVAEVLDHLAIVETRIAGMVESRVAASAAERLPPEQDRSSVLGSLDLAEVTDRSRRRITAGENSQPQAGVKADDAWQRVESSYETLRAALVAADGLALGTVSIPHRAFGAFNLYQWVIFACGHKTRHADQIREVGDALSAQSRPEAP